MKRVFAMPSTRLGRVSAGLFLLSIVLIVLMQTVFASALPPMGKLNVGPAIGVLVMLAGLIVGAIALIRDQERSWVVWLSTVPTAIVLGAEVISLLIPGE